MDTIRNLLTAQTMDMIFSDPLLSVGAILVVLGVFLFLFSATKYLRYNKTHQEFAVPRHVVEEETQSQNIETHSNDGKSTPDPLVDEPVEEAPRPAPSRSTRYPSSSDQTIVMPPGVADLQAQFEIAITQIKQLNKKIFEMERILENFQNQSDSKLEPNELKTPPSDPEDFTKKLLKVVEHVIVLEKEMAIIKAKSLETKSPIMPL